MSETLSISPEELSTQRADDDGMLDRRKLNEGEMKSDVDYEIIQLETASWEGMLKFNE